jgi:hypothetical protein
MSCRQSSEFEIYPFLPSPTSLEEIHLESERPPIEKSISQEARLLLLRKYLNVSSILSYALTCKSERDVERWNVA